MSFSSYNPNDRYRQRAAKRVTGILSFLFFLLVAFGAGYWAGQVRSQQMLYILQEEKRVLSEERDSIQDDMTQLRAQAQTANVRLEQMRANYEDLISEGAMQNLVTMLRQQIDKGIEPGRLESVILSARPPQNCTDPESKRFVIITPVYSGPNSVASIADGEILISGEGVSAQNAQGQKEAWFDPGQPVKISFKGGEGTDKVKEGVLPIYHSMVVGDKEYRFTIIEGAKSFAKITFDYCDYP